MTESTTEDLRIERVFDAPRELVFNAWLDPDQLAGWYGPEGYTVPQGSVVVEPQLEGRWELAMVPGEGGGEHPLRGKIVELEEPSLIVIENEPIPDHGIGVTHTRVELHDEDGRTRLVLTDGPYEQRMGEMAGMGWNGAFDKLAAALS